MTRPRIGLTLAHDAEGERLTLRGAYVRSVEQAGGLALGIPTLESEEVPAILDLVDALVLVGGGDIDPALYGTAPHPKTAQVSRERDDFEIALCRGALSRGTPILAICRGLQVLNVALGGTLVQDIPSDLGGGVAHDAPVERWTRVHDVQIGDGTRLEKVLGGRTFAVNSFHHQAVRDLGKGLRVSAVCPEDGVVEAIETTDGTFGLAVQWHPEAFWNRSKDFAPLFQSLVEEASR